MAKIKYGMFTTITFNSHGPEREEIKVEAFATVGMFAEMDDERRNPHLRNSREHLWFGTREVAEREGARLLAWLDSKAVGPNENDPGLNMVNKVEVRPLED